MYIVFGRKPPNEEDTKFLTLLGFDMNTMKMVGRYYMLEVPTTPEINLTFYRSNERKTNYSISYKNIPVISVETGKIYATSEPYASFHFLNRPIIMEGIQVEEQSKAPSFMSKI